nr:uncharacterized protein LOC117217541 [Megalopta genalis]XP_033321105.1 uncharacterized protein LOC117217541 [Megalopta genalis]
MPQIRKTHRKVKRVVDIQKRPQYLRNYLKYKSYVPLCEKLKTNNNSLAKALSKEKQETKLLFSQNVALLGEIQDLGSACNKRDSLILNILKDAKEMLNTLVTMTIYLTNTISTCQEFTASANTNLRRSYSPAGRRDSYRRMSTKSPTKGVVKPMVSGHTITKPTINLSRVNMQDINNASNLSVIPEVVTPPRNQETNSLRSPVSITVRQRRYASNGRPCGMPERVTVSSPRSSGEENERRLSKRRSRHSGRISGKRSRSKSNRLSGNNSTRSIGNLEYVGSPTVKLNDVSKFLQNSQSINIRLLTESRNDDWTINAENSDEMNQDDSQTSVTVPETPPSDTSENSNEQTVENNDAQVDNESGAKNEQKKENSKTLQHSPTNIDDPLEGPSWLFNNFQTVPCIINNEKKTDDNINVSIDNSTSRSSIVAETSDDSDDEKPMKESKSRLSEQESKWNSLSDSVEQGNTENDSINTLQNVNDDSVCNTFTLSTPKVTNQDEYKPDSKSTPNLVNFVTQRRGYSLEEEEEEDDFTLMYVRHPRDMQFDMNDLKFPVLEESALKPVVPVEPEPEITTTLRKISQICPLPSISNSSIDETVFNHSTVNLPLLMNNDYDNKDLTPFKEKLDSTKRVTRGKTVSLRGSVDLNDAATSFKKLSTQTNKRSKTPSKDPSTAKVVLQKLNEFDVKSRTPSPEEMHDFDQSFNHQTSLRGGNSSDSESSNASANSNHNLGRPQRKRAPTNFQEPSLRSKLRRN